MFAMRWQDWVSLVLGGWLAVSPWVLGYSDVVPATWSAVIVGVVLGAYALVEIEMPKPWEEWVNFLLGLWLMLSPLVLGFAGSAMAAWHTVAIGALVLLLAAWAMSLDKEIGKWWHDHVAGH